MAHSPPIDNLVMDDEAPYDDSGLAVGGATRVVEMPLPPKSDKALVPVPVGMDWTLLVVVLGLMTIGVVMAYSASVYLSMQAADGLDTHFLDKHLIHVAMALVLLVVGAHVPYQMWRKAAYPTLFLAIGLLLATLQFGVVVNNARRWLPLPGFMFQTAELAKLAFAFYLAHSLEKKVSSERVHQFSVGFLPHALAWAVVFGLCFKQPDLGTGIVLAVMLFTLTYVAGTRAANLVLVGLAGLGALAAFLVQNPMRWNRIRAFADQLLDAIGYQPLPETVRMGVGYQLAQAKLAVATGGAFGNGLGLSQQKLGFVPECHTDFILSIIAEELGLVGIALVALGFIVLVTRGMRIALRARDEFGRLLASGITILLGTQAAVNFGVVMGTLPTKGLTLPFVSHGGSSMLILALAAGILLNIGRGGDPDWEAPAWMQWPDWLKPRDREPRGNVRHSRRSREAA
jgi:cell division protein FtsW